MAKRYSILIIEDERNWADEMRVMVKAIPDAECDIATTAEEALQAVNKKNYDLVTCDLRLFDSEGSSLIGPNLISYIHGNSPNTKIVVVSAYVAENSDALLRFGISHVFEKQNLVRSQLVDIIQRALREPKPTTVLTPIRLDKANAIQFEDIPQDSIELLESILLGFLHSLSGKIGAAKVNIQYIRSLVEENRQDASSDLHEALERISAILDDLGMLSERLRNVAGREPTLFKSVDLNEMIRDVIKQSKYSNASQLLLDLEEQLPWLEGDRELLWHLLDNLISNALEALEDKDQNVNVKTTFARKRKRISIIVSDNGRGIAKENIPHIFKLNYSTKSRGLGIGLYLVKKCINIHGGSITCKSKLGQGTTFEVLLPIRRNSK
jgi:signal transduction histidine kinase